MEHFSKKDYQKQVSNYEKSPWVKNLIWAYTVGGLICTLGQGILTYAQQMGLPKEDAGCVTSMTLIFLSGLFTGLGVFDKIAKHAGAGTIVPITGFANAIVSPAMEFKSEGYVYGLASKMFVISGPIIVFGIASSVFVGLIYYIGYMVF